MSPTALRLDDLVRLNALATFNQWCGITVTSAEVGQVVIEMPWRAEVAQYSGFLHAGVVGALIDTACGYSAATILGTNLLAYHFSVNFLRPAVGERYLARAKVVKPGRTQVFTHCEVFALSKGKETLVSTGETLLVIANH